MNSVIGAIDRAFVHIHPISDEIDSSNAIGSPVEIAPRERRDNRGRVEIGTRKGMADVMIGVEETNTKKAEIGLALSAIIPISHSERSVTAVKQISPVMARASLRENLTEVEIIPKNLEIGLALSVTTRTFLLEISAIDVKHIDPVLEINLHPEVDGIKIVLLDPKEDPRTRKGKVTWQR